ncbi:MAG: hypothetical protein HQ565_00215 [Bacteroidetes bacterium]|nr:hypothetical protein [Bacteroidota bacterium]
MKKLLLFTISLLICFSVYSQNKDLLLFKLPDKKHTLKIKEGAWISISQRSFGADSLIMQESVRGKLNFASSDSVNIMVKEISTSFKLDSVLTKQIIIRGKSWRYEAFKSESYPLSNISTLRYQNKSGHVFTEIGTYLFFASLLTAAVAAPLVSIDYKEGTFNLDTYKSVVIAGGIGIGISIPILIFSQKKKVNFENGKTKCTRKVYTYVKPLN